MILLFLLFSFHLSSAKKLDCTTIAIPLKWKVCQTSSDCTTIEGICKSEAVNKSWKLKAKKIFAPCLPATCRASFYSEKADCKNNKCE